MAAVKNQRIINMTNETVDSATSGQSASSSHGHSSSSIYPEKFESGDIVLCLRQFDTCALANRWSAEEKLRKLPAFLRGRAATYYYALRDDQKGSYDELARHLTESLCPKVDREKFFAEFEQRKLRPGEDPAVFLWELTQLLQKANPSLPADGRTALLERQFIRGLPARTRLKLLEQDATPTLDAMVSFAQRFRAIESEQFAVSSTDQLGPASETELSTLVAAVKALQLKQQSLKDELARRPEHRPSLPSNSLPTCYRCGQGGHLARNCNYDSRRGRNTSRGTEHYLSVNNNVQCFNCHRFCHVARNCFNRPLKGRRGPMQGQ